MLLARTLEGSPIPHEKCRRFLPFPLSLPLALSVMGGEGKGGALIGLGAHSLPWNMSVCLRAIHPFVKHYPHSIPSP